MDIAATNYCRTLESMDAVRRFWSALANLHSRARTQNVPRSTGVCDGHPSNDSRDCRGFFSDKSGKKYQKPTSRTQDKQLIQQLL